MSAPPHDDHNAPPADDTAPIDLSAARRRNRDPQPPQNLEAEESLLGAMLLSRAAVDAGLEVLTGDEFYKPAHAHVFAAIQALHGRGEPVDALTVTDALTRQGTLEQAGGAGTLVALQAATPATGNAGRYARIVEEMHTYRAVIHAANTMTALAYTTPEDTDGAVAQVEQLIYSLRRTKGATTRRLDSVIHAVLERLADRAEKGDIIDGIPTGWADLDNLLLGLSPGDITIVGARPAMGKSQFAVVLGWQVALAGRPVLFASLEMKAEEIGKRWLGTVAQVRLHNIRSATLDALEWARVEGSVSTFAGVPLHVLDNYGANIAAIGHAGRRIGMDGGLVIIDYAQLVTPHSRRDANRNDQVADVSRAIKVLAGDLGCHVLLLSQLNRSVESRGDKRPMLSDLRDSGALEQDASNVLFLYRDEVYNGAGSRDAGVLEVICPKQRNGGVGVVKLAYQPAWGRIRDLNEFEAAHHGGPL